MIKSSAIKKLIKNTVFPFFTLINKVVPKRDDTILLYTANQGICYSLIPLRKYLLDNNFHSKYHIFCGIESLKYAEEEPRVTFISGISAIFKYFRSAHVFYTAGQLPIKPSGIQKVFHLRHGNANFKSSGFKTNLNNGDEFFFTHMIAPSDYFIPVMSEEYGCSTKNILVAGDPLTDQLLSYPKNSYELQAYKKILMWMPTFRQSDYYGIRDTDMKEIVPLFSMSDMDELNSKLQSLNMMLFVKLHGHQATGGPVKKCFSNLSIYTDDEFEKDGFDTYRLMAQCDCLIGDYSSASMQYLLLDRPLAFVVPDIDEYGANRTFVFPNVEEYMGGHIIKSKNDFWNFLEDIANEKDVYKEKRRWVCDQIYKYKDANSCKRIVSLNGLEI